MKKYVIYRATGRAFSKHELIGIEYGLNIHTATNDILRTVKQDLSENPSYKGCEVDAFTPEPASSLADLGLHYKFGVVGIVSPVAGKNKLVYYGIIEQDVDKAMYL